MKLLNGKELSEFIKERQAKQVRSLRQGRGIAPKLAILKTTHDPVIELYVGLKQKYGNEIGVDVQVQHMSSEELIDAIEQLNADQLVHGIIVQLPIDKPELTDEVLNAVSASKDVDGLANASNFIPATPTAIQWLLDGYNVQLKAKQIAIIGNGRLVGKPLATLLESMQVPFEVYDRDTVDLKDKVLQADVVISGTGSAGLVRADMIKQGATVVDAGVASEDGKTSGDFSEDIFLRDDLTMTPKKGGVGPLTVSALFENVIRSANLVASEQTQPPA